MEVEYTEMMRRLLESPVPNQWERRFVESVSHISETSLTSKQKAKIIDIYQKDQIEKRRKKSKTKGASTLTKKKTPANQVHPPFTKEPSTTFNRVTFKKVNTEWPTHWFLGQNPKLTGNLYRHFAIAYNEGRYNKETDALFIDAIFPYMKKNGFYGSQPKDFASVRSTVARKNANFFRYGLTKVHHQANGRRPGARKDAGTATDAPTPTLREKMREKIEDAKKAEKVVTLPVGEATDLLHDEAPKGQFRPVSDLPFAGSSKYIHPLDEHHAPTKDVAGKSPLLKALIKVEEKCSPSAVNNALESVYAASLSDEDISALFHLIVGAYDLAPTHKVNGSAHKAHVAEIFRRLRDLHDLLHEKMPTSPATLTTASTP